MTEKIKTISRGANVAPLFWALQGNPQLWNEHTMRTESEESPHHEVDDIFVRYAQDPRAQGEHDSVWYPAAKLLPVRELVMPLMTFVGGERLGGVLITRIKAGHQCKPHKDLGWHAKYYEKYAVQVQSAPGQFFCFEDQKLEPMPGDVYWFNNQHEHWVTNETAHDRITMVVCIKPDKGE